MASIKNFGHFWSESDVNWNLGNRGAKGHLKGRYAKGKRTDPVDFRKQIGIYVLFAPNREVIYVGQVGRGERATLFGRLKRHKRDHLRGRWTHFSWFGLRPVNEAGDLDDFESQAELTGAVLDELEAVLIHLFEPRLNAQRAKWKDAQEYLQYVASEVPEDDDEE